MAGRSRAKFASRSAAPLAGGDLRWRRQKLKEAGAASGIGDWPTACAIYTDLVETDAEPSGMLLQQLSNSLKMVGNFPESCRALERAYPAFVDEGEELAAVRAATGLVMMHEMFGDWAAARGWRQRGWRYLENVGPCLERGYLALASAGCDVRDPCELLERAEMALGIAREFKDHDLELRALADKGLALVCQGQADAGFALLDEVMVAVRAGEIADMATRGITLCSLMSACERTGDRGRAEEWGRAIEDDPHLSQTGIAVTHCEIVYGVVESMRGRWEIAEARLRRAMESQATGMYHMASSRSKLAELLIQQGRPDEAAKLLQGFEEEFVAAPSLAVLYIAQGDYQRAAGLLRSFTRGLGGDYVRLAPALALQVELELKRGDLAAALRAARRLLRLEDGCSSNEIRATARLAAGRIAIYQGDHPKALDELETALTLLIHRDRPLLMAQTRLELARALVGAGELASAQVEAEAALAAFHRLGVVPDINAGNAVLEGITERGLAASGPAALTAARSQPGSSVESLTRREAEVAQLVAEGRTNREVAEQLFLSVRTVETHVDRILGKLDFHTRTQLAAWVSRGELAARAWAG